MKAVLFDTLKDGDTFFRGKGAPEIFKRKISGKDVVFADGDAMVVPEFAEEYKKDTVYID